MENSVEKTLDDMLDSIKSINDDFVNNFFSDEEIAEITKENKDEVEELEDETEFEPVENSVEKTELDDEELAEDDENDLILSDFATISVENSEEEAFKELTSADYVEEDIEEEPEEYTEEELLDLIDKTNNSEEFFDRLEGK